MPETRGTEETELRREPPLAQKSRFDQTRGCWVLSRYGDVSAALREPLLRQASPVTRAPTGGDRELHMHLYATVKRDIESIGHAALHLEIQEAMRRSLDGIKMRRNPDLVRDIMQPWTIATLAGVEAAAGGSKQTAAKLARRLGGGSYLRYPQSWMAKVLARPADKVSAWRVKMAERRLDQLLKEKRLLLSKSMFLGAQTLPGFVARAWLALLRHPDQMALLTKDPSLVPAATEELLRYAGTVHTLCRHASARVKLGDVWIEEGQCVYLKVDSANFDPEQFRDPYRLNLARRAGGHLALGAGTHACPGARLVRTVCEILLPMIAETALDLDETRATAWTRDNSLQWPRSVPARIANL